jgi:hypothetical protein
VRIGDKTPRGYHAADFAEAFSRYVPDKCNKRNIRNSAGRDVADVAVVADNGSEPDPGPSTTESEPPSDDLDTVIGRLEEEFGSLDPLDDTPGLGSCHCGHRFVFGPCSQHSRPPVT